MIKYFVFIITSFSLSLAFANDDFTVTCVPQDLGDITEISVVWKSGQPHGYHFLVKFADRTEPEIYSAVLAENGYGFESTDSKIDLNLRFPIRDHTDKSIGVLVRDGKYKESSFLECTHF